MPPENLNTTIPQDLPVNVPPSVESSAQEGPSSRPDLESSLKSLFKVAPEPEESTEKPNEKPTSQSDATDQIKSEPAKEKSEGEAKKEAPKPKADPEDPRLMPEPKSMSAKGKEGWEALKQRAGKVYDQNKELLRTVDELKASLAQRGQHTSKELETYKKQIEELMPFRTMVDIHSDPEFIKEYDEPLERTKGELSKILKSANVSDEAIEALDFTDTKSMDAIIDALRDNKDKIVARKFENKVEEYIRNNDRRNEVLDKWKKDHKGFMESRKKEAFTRDSEVEGVKLNRLEMIANHKDETGKAFIPFLEKKEASDTATPEELAEVSKHNEQADKYKAQISEIIKSRDPASHVDAAVAAVASHWLKSQLDQANKKIALLEKNLSKVSNISTEKEGRTIVTTQRGDGMKPPGQRSLADAAREHFGVEVEVH